MTRVSAGGLGPAALVAGGKKDSIGVLFFMTAGRLAMPGLVFFAFQ